MFQCELFELGTLNFKLNAKRQWQRAFENNLSKILELYVMREYFKGGYCDWKQPSRFIIY